MTRRRPLTTNHAPGPHFEPAGDDDLSAAALAVKLIAFYLPQFHPIAENDAWWGTGFTEWTNVSKALPRFRGHYQPRLPADLGFYDLRLPEILARQARLARRHGVYGFCFYHYWFAGRRLLERPVETLLAHPEIDLPFCLSWANENWTRTWDGGSAQVLMGQEHTAENDLGLIDSMLPAFRDPRYIRVDGRPIVLLYRASILPDPAATVVRWRERVRDAGLGDPLVVMTQSFDEYDPRAHGLEAAAEFPPHNYQPRRRRPVYLLDGHHTGDVVEYEEIASDYVARPPVDYPVFRGLMTSWDNEARRPGRGRAFRGSTPALYGRWLDAACRRVQAELAPSQRLVFVNAWNEWAEGAYLEPDRHFGHAYLRETARVLQRLGADDVSPTAPTGGAGFEVDSDRSLAARARRATRQQMANAYNAVQRVIQRRPT